jgi:hypothetical protein
MGGLLRDKALVALAESRKGVESIQHGDGTEESRRFKDASQLHHA